MKKNNIYLLFSVLGAVLVLWQMLGSGYVLTLDMVFGPHVNLVHNAGDLLNGIPTWYILSFLTSILGGWVTQKILLVAIFFSLFYLPLRFFKRIFNLETTGGAEYVVSLFFAINPFVYERFLAGQWLVIVGYLLLMPFTAYLAEFCRTHDVKQSWRQDAKLLGILILLGATSIHVFIMAILVTMLVGGVTLVYYGFSNGRRGLWENAWYGFLQKCILLGLAVAIASSYWVVPALRNKTTQIAAFGPAHWEAFRTAGDGQWGTAINVVTLYGFWGEHEAWVSRFAMLKYGGWFFATFFALFISLVIAGIYAGVKDKKLRGIVMLLVVVLALAVVFSCGTGDGVFRNFNLWLFMHVSFWKGFRDSEKWSAWVALAYALLAGVGFRWILQRFSRAESQRIALYVAMAVPLIYTPMMLWGFVGQLHAVQYPEAWARVNDIIKQEPNCRALFLPWQEYYSLRFNNNLLTGNTARDYFACDIVSGKNVELGGIGSDGDNGAEYNLIENAVMDNNADPDVVISLLKKRGLQYIIFTTDIQDNDYYLYPFLTSKKIRLVINRLDGVYLYEIR